MIVFLEDIMSGGRREEDERGAGFVALARLSVII
jgi:hypothetical protein